VRVILERHPAGPVPEPGRRRQAGAGQGSAGSGRSSRPCTRAPEHETHTVRSRPGAQLDGNAISYRLHADNAQGRRHLRVGHAVRRQGQSPALQLRQGLRRAGQRRPGKDVTRRRSGTWLQGCSAVALIERLRMLFSDGGSAQRRPNAVAQRVTAPATGTGLPRAARGVR
jgi:hypothetical protein